MGSPAKGSVPLPAKRGKKAAPEEGTSAAAPEVDTPPVAPLDQQVGGTPAPGKPSPAPHGDGEAIRISIDDAAFAPSDPTYTYWVGTTSKSPLQNVALGGICFPKYTGAFRYTGGGDLIEPSTRGAVVELTEKDVKKVIAAVQNKLVRKHGNGCYIVTKSARNFRPQGTDRPVGCFIYMVHVGEMMPRKWQENEPPAMVQLSGE